MLYFSSSNKSPVHYIESGNLIKDSDFLHANRNLDFFAFLFGLEGCLYIEQDGKEYTMKPGDFVLLFPHHNHRGYRASEGKISYYWAHFTLDNYKEYSDKDAPQLLPDYSPGNSRDIYMLPSLGHYSSDPSRIQLEFRQLIDFSMQQLYSPSITDYMLSVILMDVTNDYILKKHSIAMNKTAYSMVDLQEYIRVNYDGDLSVVNLANMFGYNSNYLSTAFKKATGVSLVSYINRTRILIAKSLLLETNSSIIEIAEKVGFHDVKYFIRVFRSIENMTPSMFRKVYYRKYTNRE